MSPMTGFWERLALAETHALRVRILRRIREAEEPISPARMAREFREEVGKIGYHTRALEKIGLVVLDREVPVRGAIEHFYRLAPDAAAARVDVGHSEEVALAALEVAFFQALEAGVKSAQIAQRFTELEAREAGEAVLA